MVDLMIKDVSKRLIYFFFVLTIYFTNETHISQTLVITEHRSKEVVVIVDSIFELNSYSFLI